MRYYNQATGEFRYLPDTEEQEITSLDYAETIIPKESRMKIQRNDGNRGFSYFDWLGIEGINLSNLNFEYIMNNLRFDDILIIGLIILLLSDWTEDDLYLVLILVFILVSEWIIIPKGEIYDHAA